MTLEGNLLQISVEILSSLRAYMLANSDNSGFTHCELGTGFRLLSNKFVPLLEASCFIDG